MECDGAGRKTSVDPSSLAGALRQQVWAIDKDQPVFDVRTMQEVRSGSVALYSFSSVMLGIFAVVALVLAAIGIYGVMAFAVTQRTQEIGIRMALGARTADVLKLVVKHGMKLALLGIVIGLAGSWALTRFIQKLLVGVQPTDLLTFSVVSLCLLVAAFIACYLPARRATKVDPLDSAAITNKVDGIQIMETLIKDIRYGVRGLLKRKGFCCDCRANPRPRNWGQYRNLHARQRSDVEIASR
jgi:predicted lysophospholipase L1 biosynthesis ABC-type transport system permease subunit